MSNFLVCPKCNENITYETLTTNAESVKALDSLVHTHEQKYKKELEDNLRKELSQEFEVKFLQKNESFNKQMADERLSFEKKIMELESVKKEFETNLALEKAKVEKQLKDEVFKQIEILRQQKDSEINELREQNTQLTIANEKNKVIQNKTKGENFEHEVEAELRKVFDMDIIEKITTRDQKADYLQIVQQNNQEIGRIVYEVKNAEWKPTWEKKLLEDTVAQKGKYGILIATSFNEKYRGIPFKVSDVAPNIFLTDPDSFVFVSQIIKKLIQKEYEFESKSGVSTDEASKEFNNWRELIFAKANQNFEEQIKRIYSAENSIIKQADEIRIGREKISSIWKNTIKEFIDNFKI